MEKLLNRAEYKSSHKISGSTLFQIKNTCCYFTVSNQGQIEHHKMNTDQWLEHMHWLTKGNL